MALSAAFSMTVIIIGVAKTGGSVASLNWLARCAGATRSVNVPFAPIGMARTDLGLEAEQLQQVGRIGEDLPRLAEAGVAAELAPARRGLGKVAGDDVLPDLLPLRLVEDLPRRPCNPPEAVEKRRAILVREPRRLIQQEDAAAAGGGVDHLHQSALVVGLQVMDRQAAPGRVGVLVPRQHGFDEIAVVEIDLERHCGEILGGELERRL